jgi:hypothetical protein
MGIKRFRTSLLSQAKDYGVMSGRSNLIPIASGGTITESGGYRIHSFTSGISNFTQSSSFTVEYLIVAGGGGAGGTQNGISHGGNAGQVISGSTILNSGFISISVGVAGTAGPGWSTSSFAQPGGNSSIQNLQIATGGASGANTFCCPSQSSGGTGGGGTSSSGNQPGTGISSSISGVSTSYGNTVANGALNVAPPARAANSGDGGQPVWSQGSLTGGAGGSGIVIIRYLNAAASYNFD